MQSYRLISCLFYLQILFFVNAVSYNELLQGYMRNDLEAQKLQLELEAARSNLQLFYYNNLVKFTFGTSGTFTFSNDEVTLDFTPELSLEFPEWRNTSFSFKFPTNIPLASSADDSYIPDVSIEAKTDIFPFKKKITRNDVELVEKKREILQKERSVEQQILVIRAAFLSLLKEVFQAKYNVDEAYVDHSDAIRDLDLAKFQGYGENSLEFKRLNLAVSKKLRLINEQKRVYQQKLQHLATECAMEIDELPSDLPEAELPDIESLTLQRYKDYDNAVYTKYRNDLNRKLEKNDKNFSLAGSVGYEAKTDDSSNKNYTTSSKSHYIAPGITTSYNGFESGVGVNIPLTQDSSPELTFSVSWSPLTIVQTRLENKIRSLEEKGDSLDIAQIAKDFKVKFDELLLKKETLEWQRDTYESEEEVYMQQAEEYEKRHNIGYVSDSEYERAIIEYQSAVTQNLLGKIERLIFVCETANLFLPNADVVKGE